ncbi:poly-gamma-glutamate hydrolase family protein [Methyloversatilis sp.]|uniref:poly-gamma-glutamate hydrolase family protein n=1 Tax=Methyloversatilis sp. TaxID=2569862 RepID=UPI0027331929|nr:poly-gamma-glutamate hydrolase family protein [Methyloversatilis sp.]MDP2870094.1 poly-gamma-glutamate hydrolase family protein [Methyloversatilis sp.]MDP3456768.1 poly-gamma-glutamate hydrolase family protein [Methyloversatilis sp.]MDP3580023.1 poly-gamma-glutamate hydrolase family protein [Methyloversatilis sp.]
MKGVAVHRDRYRNFGELAAAHVDGRDYRITVKSRGSGIAVIAPHGGRIERGTSEVARAIAGEAFDLYLFEGCLPSLNFETLHLTSRHFDEPRALALLAGCHTVLAVHGVADTGQRALLGGRDCTLACAIADRLFVRGVRAQVSGHRYPGRDAANVCNRGSRGQGVQLELSDRLRGGALEPAVVEAVRCALQDRFNCRRAVAPPDLRNNSGTAP